jgi:hypothetical protein
MGYWGPGLLENDVGDALRSEWEALIARPGEHPHQPYINASYRWTIAWKASSDGGNPNAWIALAVLQASVEYLDEDVTLEALAAIDRGATFVEADLSAEDQMLRHAALRELRELLARTIGDEGTEDDLHRIAALGSRSTLGPS